MSPVLTADAMRAADEETIRDFGIASTTLMETAGRAVAASVADELALLRPGADEHVCIVCGTGNNGGDGLVAARALHESGFASTVVITGGTDRLSPDASHNLTLLRTLVHNGAAIDIRHEENGDDDVVIPSSAPVIVDALLGTGVRGPARSPAAAWISAMNGHRAATIAVDVPSGIDATTGRVGGVAVRAQTTVTFGAIKTGLLLNDGPALAGRVRVAPIGIPRHVLEKRTRDRGCAALITRDDVVLPERPANAHKYTSGLLYALCGSVGMTGAAVLALESAMRVGAGAARCATGARSQPVLAERFTEVVTEPLEEDDDGLVADAAAIGVLQGADRASAVLIGCGCGRSPGTVDTIRRVLDELDRPAVIDADGLYALRGDPQAALRNSRDRWILTPHRREFERLTGKESDWDDRIELARRFSREWNCVLVLKGLPSVIGCPDGRVLVGSSASTSLATAGAGDVLAGMIAGFLAQGLSSVEAAAAALYTGGIVTDRYERAHTPNTLLATDLLIGIPDAIRDLRFV